MVHEYADYFCQQCPECLHSGHCNTIITEHCNRVVVLLFTGQQMQSLTTISSWLAPAKVCTVRKGKVANLHIAGSDVTCHSRKQKVCDARVTIECCQVKCSCPLKADWG